MPGFNPALKQTGHSHPSTRVDGGGSELGHPLLHSEFWVSLGCVRPCLRQQQKKNLAFAHDFWHQARLSTERQELSCQLPASYRASLLPTETKRNQGLGCTCLAYRGPGPHCQHHKLIRKKKYKFRRGDSCFKSQLLRGRSR